MCNLAALTAGIVTWCVAGPSGALAQSVGELERRVDSLEAEVAHLQERDARWARSMGAGPRADTLIAGDLTFLVTGGDANPGARGAQRAREILENQFRLPATLFRDRPIAITIDRRAPGGLDRWAIASIVAEPHAMRVSSGRLVSSLTGEEDTEALARIFVESALHALRSRIDTTLGFWSSDIALGDYAGSSHDAAYVELVTSPLSAIRGCARDVVGACRRALGLTPAVDRILEWYDQEDRRLEVSSLLRTFDNPYWHQRLSDGDRQRYQACLDGSDVLCAAMLSASDLGRVAAGAPPFSKQVRADFLSFALDVGADGAVRRLLETDRPLEERLSRAADLPLDVLVARWHAAITGVKGQNASVPAGAAGAAMAWTLVFLALATRSSRWR